MNIASMKKMAINVMIGSLIGSAVIAVVAVLIGQFNDILGRALLTLLIVALHALASLGFLESRSKVADAADTQTVTNTIFILIVCSFVTAVFGNWDLATPVIVGKLYLTYFIVAFAVLHGEMLFKTRGLEARIDNIVKANYVFMSVVIALLIPVVWITQTDLLPDFYYRLLAATAIVDATLTILAVILHKLYIQKHPKAPSQLFSTVPGAGGAAAPKRKTHPLLIILGLFLLLQFVVPLLFWFGGVLFTR